MSGEPTETVARRRLLALLTEANNIDAQFPLGDGFGLMLQSCIEVATWALAEVDPTAHRLTPLPDQDETDDRDQT